MRTEHKTHLHIVYIRDSSGWVAQTLQHDFAGQGKTQDAALKALVYTLASHFEVAQRLGIEDPLGEVEAAPAWYWDLFEQAAKAGRTRSEDVPGMPFPAFAIQAIA